MNLILVELQQPLVDGGLVVSELRARHGEAGHDQVPVPPADPALVASDWIAVLVDEGTEQVVVSLDRLATPDADDIHRITSFVWSVLSAGAQPVVLAGDRDTADVVRHYKMDRAFTVCSDLESAVAHLTAGGQQA